MDKLNDILYRLQDHPLYRRWEEIPKQRKMLGFASAGLGVALILLVTQVWGGGTPKVELKPDAEMAAKQSAREADTKMLSGLDEKGLKEEADRRKLAMEGAKKSGDEVRMREAEESWERANEMILDKKK